MGWFAMAKKKNAEKIDVRTYKVVTREEALSMGAKPPSDSPYNLYLLCTVRGTKLEDVLTWGYKREPLDKRADERNKNAEMLKKMMGDAIAEIEKEDE
jgi:hypothetical protein